MLLSRRNFLRTVGIGAAAGTAVSLPLAGLSSAARFEPFRTLAPTGPIRLNSNENAYGPPPKAAAAIRSAISSANRYPFAGYEGLVERIAGLHKVKAAQVVVGCGSTEILRVAAMTFLGSGKRLLQAAPTFEAIEHYAQSTGAEVISIPLAYTFAHDLDAMLGQANPATTLVYICNPNNPTASITPRHNLEAFMSKLPASCYVVIDEAYHHFAGRSGMYSSFLDEPVHDDRVIVSRTFSKVYGLAGLRLGYGIAAPAVAKRMNSYLTEDSVNGVVLQAAMAALEDTETVADFIQRNQNVRQEFFNQCNIRMLKPIDSHANFVMMNIGHPAEEMIQYFRQNNVLIGRRFPAMDTYIRVSLGTPAEMKVFWSAWDRSPFPKMHAMHP